MAEDGCALTTGSLDARDARQPAYRNGPSGGPHGEAWSVTASMPISYEVRIERNLLDPGNDTLVDRVFSGAQRRRLFVVEHTVFELYGQRLEHYAHHHRLPVHFMVVDADERGKGLDLAMRIVDAMDEMHMDRRREPLVAIGGGVLLDVVGWAASVFRRGTPFIRIPTTFLAMIDAGVGIKTGINHRGRKSLLGSYHPPKTVLIDPAFLRTLPRRQLGNGLAEAAKLGLICDAELWSLLANHAAGLLGTVFDATEGPGARAGEQVLRRAVNGMIAQLQPNLWERDLQRLVDFGHTFSPAVEMAALPDLLHGEAVALDMALSCALAAGRGLQDEGTLDGVLDVLLSLGLPVTHPDCRPDVVARGLAESVVHRSGRQLIPVPIRPGHATFLDGVTDAELRAALRRLDERVDARLDTPHRAAGHRDAVD